MKQADPIYEELQGMDSFLAAYPRVMPLECPKGYFASLPGTVLKEVKEASIGGIPVISMPPLRVPEGYFEGLPVSMLDKARRAEAPLELPFETAPAGYFESLPQQLLDRAKARDQEEGWKRSHPWPPSQKRINVPAWSWSIAASLVFLLSLGWFTWTQSGTDGQVPIADRSGEHWATYALESWDDADTEWLMDEWKQSAGGDFEALIEDLDPSAVAAYLAEMEEEGDERVWADL